jgi:hypothetical protein
LIPDGDVSIFH